RSVGQPLGDIFDGAADRVSCIQRALRAAKDLDPVDVIDIQNRSLRSVEINVVQVKSDALLEAGDRVLLADTANEGCQCRIGRTRIFDCDVWSRIADVGDVSGAFPL